MQKAKYFLTHKAVEDLSDIWEYTYEEWSEKQANKYYKLLVESCQEVANNPNFGKSYESVLKDLLGFKAIIILFSLELLAIMKLKWLEYFMREWI